MLRDEKPVLALEAFKLNAQKNPNVFITDMGLMRGYSANGDFKNALKYAKLAQPLAATKPIKIHWKDLLKCCRMKKTLINFLFQLQ